MLPRLRRRLGRELRLRGSSMVEVMVALLVFATAMTGMLIAHLEARRGAAEALQRSAATLLAQDMLERIRGNPREVATYAGLNLVSGSGGRPRPAQDCSSSDCTPLQLARYDIWHWESLLADLDSPSACISRSPDTVTLALVWRGIGNADPFAEIPCVIAGAGLYDDPAHAPGNNLRRRSLTITTGLDRAIL